MSDLINREHALDFYTKVCAGVECKKCPFLTGTPNWNPACKLYTFLSDIPSAQPEVDEIARDIATIIKNTLDMTVIQKNVEQHWIPCSKRTPEAKHKSYWVCTDTEYQCECRWTNNRFGIGEGEWGWSIFDTPQYSKPIAWRPLPKPWKGEDNETD